MKGMKNVELLVQQPRPSRYGRERVARSAPPPLLPYLFFVLDYPGPLQAIVSISISLPQSAMMADPARVIVILRHIPCPSPAFTIS